MRATPVDVRYVYRLLLGREPDVEGYRHNCELVEEKGLNMLELARHFMESSEFHATHAGGPAYEKFPKPVAPTVPLDCQACTQSQIESANFKYWASCLHEMPGKLHRKLCLICAVSQPANTGTSRSLRSGHAGQRATATSKRGTKAMSRKRRLSQQGDGQIAKLLQRDSDERT